MLAHAERASSSWPSPPPIPPAFLVAELGPAVMADDPCEAAFGSADPTGPRNYYRARYYDPKIGRFISEDPLRFDGGNNFYAYVDNNPVNRTDPLGLFPIPVIPDWLICTVRINRQVIAGHCGNGKNVITDPSCREAHCIANCRITRECTGGGATAATFSYAKEGWDWAKQQTWDPNSEGYSQGDQAANKKGRVCGQSSIENGDCLTLCRGTR